jgi:hypothetical protein
MNNLTKLPYRLYQDAKQISKEICTTYTYTRRRIRIPPLQGRIVPWTISTREIIGIRILLRVYVYVVQISFDICFAS